MPNRPHQDPYKKRMQFINNPDHQKNTSLYDSYLVRVLRPKNGWEGLSSHTFNGTKSQTPGIRTMSFETGMQT